MITTDTASDPMAERVLTRTLSLRHELYLDSHRLHGTPHMPMVMLQEELCAAELMAHEAPAWISIETLTCEQPLFLRQDRDKSVRVRHERSGESLSVHWFADANLTYARGRIRPLVRAPVGRSTTSLVEVPVTRGASVVPAVPGAALSALALAPPTKRTHALGRSLYAALLPHGPHFQCDVDLYACTPTALCCRVHAFASERDFYPGVPLCRLHSHPAAVDAALQLCAVHYASQSGRFALPVRVRELCIDLATPHRQELLCCITRGPNETQEGATTAHYSFALTSLCNAPVALCADLALAPARQPLDPNHLEALHDHLRC